MNHLARIVSRIERVRSPMDKRENISGAPQAAPALARLSLAARLADVRPTSAVNVADPFVVRTARLNLRPLREQDQGEFLRVLRASRRHLRAHCPLGDPNAIDESDEAVFARQLNLSLGAAATGRAWRQVAFTHDGRLIGGFNLNDISRGLEHHAELVYWISADAAGKGYASEGQRAVLEHAFADLPKGLGLHKVIGLISPDNAPCIAAARKGGFKLNAKLSRVELTLNGKPEAHDVYEVFAPVGTVVEGKPSVARELFGTGLLSILRTEESRER